MHTISGLLYPDDPTDHSRSVVVSIDRRGEAIVIVAAALHDGELPHTLLISPDMPCYQFFARVSDLAVSPPLTGSATAAAPGRVAIAGSP